MGVEVALIDLVNFGLVVLIWIVQLTVYPSFHFLDVVTFNQWHQRYTKAITYIVLPLMLTQLIWYVITVFQKVGFTNLLTLLLVFATWWTTMFIAVPLHGKLSYPHLRKEAINGLISINWKRTFLWTFIFLINIFLK